MALPSIIISARDRERLVSVAMSALGSNPAPATASNLLSEVARATIFTQDAVPPSVVAMGSEVEIHDDVRKSRARVRLVYPDEVAMTPDAISVLTPLGVALIGLSKGASMEWCTATGDLSRITVLRVLPGHEQVRPNPSGKAQST
jgi:regulator of nucleoside diphosphate kinase